MDIDMLEKLDFLNTKNDELEKVNNELKEELKNKDIIIQNELNSKNDIIKNKDIEIDNIKRQLKSEKDNNVNKEYKIQNLESKIKEQSIKIEELESKISKYKNPPQLPASDESVVAIQNARINPVFTEGLEPEPIESSLSSSNFREKRIEGVAVDASEHQEPSPIIFSLSKLWLYRYYILGIISIILLVYNIYTESSRIAADFSFIPIAIGTYANNHIIIFLASFILILYSIIDSITFRKIFNIVGLIIMLFFALAIGICIISAFTLLNVFVISYLLYIIMLVVSIIQYVR